DQVPDIFLIALALQRELLRRDHRTAARRPEPPPALRGATTPDRKPAIHPIDRPFDPYRSAMLRVGWLRGAEPRFVRERTMSQTLEFSHPTLRETGAAETTAFCV